MRWMRTALALGSAVAMVACGSDSTTGLPSQNDATVTGSVQETTAMPGPSATPGAQGAAAASASTVAVGNLDSSGQFHMVAEGSVQADGTFRVEGVPANRNDLYVQAYGNSGDVVGSVRVYETTHAGTETATAPITAETTLRTSTWARIKADGMASSTSEEEVALLLHPGASASASVVSSGDVDATASGVAMASSTMTQVYAGMNVSMDASARASLIVEAARAYASARAGGASESAAFATYSEAALNAWIGAGADLESTVAATAGAASTFDAEVHGRTSARGQTIAEAVRMNIQARERLAAQFQDSAEGAVALQIMNALSTLDASVRLDGATAAQIHAAMQTASDATVSATTDAMVDLLVPGASALLRSDVKAKAEAVVAAARMDTRLSAAASANAAAQAMANYRSEVHAAVEAMIQASGNTDMDADAMTSLYIAAHGGAYIRAE